MTRTVNELSSLIAVFSGNDCNLLNEQDVCDQLFEQLPQTSGIGTAYVVPAYLYSNTKIRIIASGYSIIFFNCTYKPMSKL